MKRFVLMVGGQSLTFSVGDLDAMQAALDEAVAQPDRQAFRNGASGPVSVTLYSGAPNGSSALVQAPAGAVRMTDGQRTRTDC